MCVVSNMGNFWGQRLPEQYPWIIQPSTANPSIKAEPIDWSQVFKPTNAPSKEEYEALKKEVEIMKQILIQAKLYDEANNEPNCEIDEKIEKLKAIAALVGISLDDIFISKKKKVEDKQVSGNSVLDNININTNTNTAQSTLTYKVVPSTST